MQRLYIILLIVIVLVVWIFSAYGVEQFKITAEDGAEIDLFGYSVSIDGDYAVVGAMYDDDDGENSGSAYIFFRDDDEWTQQAKLTANDADAGDNFGHFVSISGNYAIIGAPNDGQNSGSAYIFVRDGEEWTQQQKLTANDAAGQDFFGCSVSISGNYVIIGGYGNDDDGENSGSVYIFRLNGDEWTQQQKLTADDASREDLFGYSVSIDNDRILVGAHGNSDDGRMSGSAYIFIRDDEEWIQQQKLTVNDAEELDLFGYSVSISGDFAIVGAHGNDDGGDRSGSAYIFVLNDEDWTQQQLLVANDAARFNFFGYSVSIFEDEAIVGAYGTGGNIGASYYFTRSNEHWSQIRLIAMDPGREHVFGYSVAINEGTAIIGSHGDNDDGDRSGSAYLLTSFLDPEIFVLPVALNFGTVMAGESEERVITISNDGMHNLIISDIAIVGNYFFSNFEDSVTIETGDTLTVFVAFTPEETGEFNGILTITSNDPDEEELIIELHGIGNTEIKFNRIEFYQNVNAPESNPDNLIDPGRDVRFKVLIVNELDRNILMGNGTIESRTEGIEVIEEEVSFNNIRSGQTGWSVREFEVAVADTFEAGESGWFRLIVTNEVEPEGPWISNFSFPIAPIQTNRVLMDDDDNPDSNGDDDDIAEPGETIEIIPLIGNLSPDTWHEVSGLLRFAGQGNFINVWNEVEGATGIVLNTWQYNHIDNQQQPIEPDDENIQPEEDYVFDYSEEAQDVWELPFDLIISGYLNEAPGNNWNEGGVLMKWSSRFMVNEGEGNSVPPNRERNIPTEFMLSEPYPNPFNSSTRITCQLPIETHLDLGLYDLSGRRVMTLFSGVRQAGIWSTTLDGGDLSSGVYFVKIGTDDVQLSQKIVLIR